MRREGELDKLFRRTELGERTWEEVIHAVSREGGTCMMRSYETDAMAPVLEHVDDVFLFLQL